MLVDGRVVRVVHYFYFYMVRGGGSVPISRLPQLVYETKGDLAEVGLKSTIVGHVGDGKIATTVGSFPALTGSI